MEFSIGITPEGVLNWIIGILYKFLLWICSGWRWYLYIVAFIVVLIISYKLLDNYLYNKYRGKYENSRGSL